MDSTGSAETEGAGTRELTVDDQSWRVLCWNEADRRLVMKSSPSSAYQGGGPPHLEEVRDEGELATDLREPGWTTRTPDDVVAFLVDRWCERRPWTPCDESSKHDRH